MSKALFAGSFDPITKGHEDLIKRASKLFDEVYVVLMINHEKKFLLPLDTRLSLMKQSLEEYPNVILDAYDGLTIQYAKEHDIPILIRGVRTVTDYEYELQIANVNAQLNSNIETMFLLSKPELSFISSSNMKAVAVQHGDISAFVSPHVEEVIKNSIGS